MTHFLTYVRIIFTLILVIPCSSNLFMIRYILTICRDYFILASQLSPTFRLSYADPIILSGASCDVLSHPLYIRALQISLVFLRDPWTLSHPISLFRTLSHPISSFRTISRLISLFWTLSRLISLFWTLSRPIASFRTLRRPIFFRTKSCPISSVRILSCPISAFWTLSRPISAFRTKNRPI